ncbi:MAG: DUF4258 domain-containing protein [Fimbriimonas ginsengisoli]|uniref:DUF4258 domain-containing protein n=1 Tax=Fimbriimonas ginsengisoli TaxID=1005039 RepID=A0A931LTP9_FIMGI|nr:DUF4258 domain-containing protein [Fimbriimonas ginsengisoli]
MKLVFRAHAIQRLFERGVSVADVERLLASGRTIEEYPGDFPFPSRLVLGFIGERPIQIVVAEHRTANEAIIITVYEPNAAEWEPGFAKRKT